MVQQNDNQTGNTLLGASYQVVRAVKGLIGTMCALGVCIFVILLCCLKVWQSAMAKYSVCLLVPVALPSCYAVL